MRLRPVVLCTLAVGLVAGGAALAAPKPVCNLIVDPEGDGKERLTPVGVSSQALDILSVDVATGKKELVGVIRLKSTQTTTDPLAYTGIKWSLAFSVGGVNHSFTLSRSSTPLGVTDRTSSSVGGSPADGVVGTVDGSSVTFKVPRTSLPALKKPRQVLSNMSAISYVGGGAGDIAIGNGKAAYTDQTPSCVKPA